jgi:hypothetical protein
MWTISSQATDVRTSQGSPGQWKVQRLGGEETIIRPRAPGIRKDDDIVWTAWQHAEAGIESLAITARDEHVRSICQQCWVLC